MGAAGDAPVRDGPGEGAVVLGALAGDEECTSGDDACALNALQMRSARSGATEGESKIRRHECPHSVMYPHDESYHGCSDACYHYGWGHLVFDSWSHECVCYDGSCGGGYTSDGRYCDF